jgi:hypothetical protein
MDEIAGIILEDKKPVVPVKRRGSSERRGHYGGHL